MVHIAMYLALCAAFLFSLGLIFQKSLYKSAICLLGILMQVAVMFYLAGSPLLAFLQVMIYAGAVIVLLVITIMASPLPAESPWSGLPVAKPLALAVLAALAIEGYLVFFASVPAANLPINMGLDTKLGPFLFGPYALATEAVGFLMLLAALAVLTVEEKN
jgi:NADH-quinone oxidoreductase subunit J